MRKLIYAFLMLTSVNAFAGEWIADPDTGCQVWNPAPSPGESIKWSGACSNNIATGNGTVQWYLNGKPGLRQEGEFRDGKLNGKGMVTAANGLDWYKGDFVDSKQTGKGIRQWSNGDRYEGDFVDTKMMGKGVYIWSNGVRYEGDFVNGKQTGKGIKQWPNGDRYEGDFVDGKQAGKGIYVSHKGIRYEGDFVDDQITGKSILYFKNGNKLAGSFVNGELSGEGSFTSVNGETQKVIRSPDGNNYVAVSASGVVDNDFDFDNAAGVFTDKRTGLMWRRCAIGRNWDANSNQCKGDTKNASWADMIRLVHDAKYAGLSDWRLPTAEEYKTLIGANGKFNCKEMKNTIKRYFPNIYSPTMFGSNHWLADNSKDLMLPFSTDMELTIGMLGCPIIQDSLRPHAEQPAIMVRGGAVPEKWTFALSKMHLTKELNAKSRATGEKYWNGVNKKVNDFFTAPATGTSNPNSSNSYCSTSDTCFETVSTRGDEVTLKCTKGNNTGQTRKISGPNANGKWAYSLGGYHRGFREAGNFACE